jgi:hypothetical protein
LRSADPEPVRQEIWARLTVHHCLTRIIMRLAGQERIDPDRLSFIKVLKHVRRSVIRQSAQTPVQIKRHWLAGTKGRVIQWFSGRASHARVSACLRVA